MTTASLTHADPYAVFDALVTHLAAVTTRPIGEADRPGPATSRAHDIAPYAVIYPIDETGRVGTLANHQGISTIAYQATSVGVSARQALDMSNDIRQALTAGTLTTNPLTIPGADLISAQLGDSGPIERDDTQQPPLFYVIDEIELALSHI